jgi:uncharacterized protein (UPF0335 family)
MEDNLPVLQFLEEHYQKNTIFLNNNHNNEIYATVTSTLFDHKNGENIVRVPYRDNKTGNLVYKYNEVKQYNITQDKILQEEPLTLTGTNNHKKELIRNAKIAKAARTLLSLNESEFMDIYFGNFSQDLSGFFSNLERMHEELATVNTEFKEVMAQLNRQRQNRIYEIRREIDPIQPGGHWRPPINDRVRELQEEYRRLQDIANGHVEDPDERVMGLLNRIYELNNTPTLPSKLNNIHFITNFYTMTPIEQGIFNVITYNSYFNNPGLYPVNRFPNSYSRLKNILNQQKLFSYDLPLHFLRRSTTFHLEQGGTGIIVNPDVVLFLRQHIMLKKSSAQDEIIAQSREQSQQKAGKRKTRKRRKQK